MAWQATPMRFVEVDAPGTFSKPCLVCVTHKPNSQGYLYKTWSVAGVKIREAFHRFILRAHKGWPDWPQGLECDHICGNRTCSEPSHLRAIGISDHKAVTNTLRYSERNEEARLHWMVFNCTGTELAALFGVTISTGCRWIRQWKAEDEADALAFAAH